MGWEGGLCSPSSPCPRFLFCTALTANSMEGIHCSHFSTWIPCQTLCKESWESPGSWHTDCKASGRWLRGRARLWGRWGPNSMLAGCIYISIFITTCLFLSTGTKASQPLFMRRRDYLSIYEKGAGYSIPPECPLFCGADSPIFQRLGESRGNIFARNAVSDSVTMRAENADGASSGRCIGKAT